MSPRIERSQSRGVHLLDRATSIVLSSASSGSTWCGLALTYALARLRTSTKPVLHVFDGLGHCFYYDAATAENSRRIRDGDPILADASLKLRPLRLR